MRSKAFNKLTGENAGVENKYIVAARAVLQLQAFDGVCRDLDSSHDGFDSAALLAHVARVIRREVEPPRVARSI